jgi:enoyl-CoA hydratase/carnithine racemase
MMRVIDYEVTDGIAYIRLNRPEKLNAFTNSGLTEYVAALDRLDRDDSVQVGIVSGAGRAFSSGSDVNQRLQHASIVAGNFKWDTTDGFKDAIRAAAR